MISVDLILFCYNQEQYIEQALRSIYEQELPKDLSVRIIVADDCSSDGTLSVIKHLAEESPFPVIFLPAEPNMGISKNYKRSFAATEADYVAILEGDDYWLPNHIAQHVDFLQTHRKYSMSINSITFLESGNLNNLGWAYPMSYVSISVKEQIACGNQLGNLSACVFRGEYMRNLPSCLFDTNIADWEIGILMATRGPICKYKQSTSVYRLNSSGQWSQLDMTERTCSRISTINNMEKFTNYKYHSEFETVRKRIENGGQFSIVPYSFETRVLLLCHVLIKKLKQVLYK